jgi:2-keto-4-pentenoate hydratase
MTSNPYDVPGSRGPRPGTTVVDDAVTAAGDRLAAADRTRTPCSPVRDLIGRDDVAAAYLVQQHLNRTRLERGAVVVGRKIGATSKAVQAQLGVDQPDFGVLFDDMDVTALDEVPSERLLQPKAEAEVAFVLKEGLADGDLDVDQCRAAVDYAVAAIEIVDSRIADWKIGITDTVADNASSGLYVLGDRKVPLDEFEPIGVQMTMTQDGEQVSQGDGSMCLGDPLLALSWLARTARDYGQPLEAGQVVLSGALGPMVPAPPGSTFEATISSLGTVTAHFSTLDQEDA